LTRRALIALFTIFAALTITFFLVRNMPGDIIHAMAMDMVMSQNIPFDVAYEEATGMYGIALNEPLYVQYFDYVKELFTGNLGTSVHYKIPVATIVAQALPWTAFVCSVSLVLSFAIGTLIGMLTAWKRRTLLDPIVSAYASITDATPDYITATILLIIFAINLKWFPLRGAYTAGLTPGFNARFILDVFYHAILPITAYTIESIGGWALLMKSNAVSILGEDYVTAARARGLRDRRIAVSYVGRNAVLPPFTGLAIAFGGMLGGSALIESVFAYPGIGFFFGAATGKRDYPLMQGLFLLTIGGVIVANLLADFLYSRLDPRVRLGGG
jgi:peptide/nickel transport system permease protein